MSSGQTEVEYLKNEWGTVVCIRVGAARPAWMDHYEWTPTTEADYQEYFDAPDEEDEEEEVEPNYPTVSIDGTDVDLWGKGFDGPESVERVSVSFPDAENGYQSEAQERAPLGWANSAQIVLDRDEDSITLLISVGDPRGAFAFTVRRTQDGELRLTVPHPSDGLLHMPLTEDPGRGMYKIGH